LSSYFWYQTQLQDIAPSLKKLGIPFVGVADTFVVPKKLYNLGVSYVVQTEHEAAHTFAEVKILTDDA